MKWILFLSIVILQIAITLEPFLKSCQDLDGFKLFVFISHHFLEVFLFWSFLFLTRPFEFQLHIVTAIIVGFLWFIYDYTCIWTVYMNYLCGFPKQQWLDSLVNRTGLRNISEYYHSYWLVALIGYDIYMLMK
jgi:hypothetical protein